MIPEHVAIILDGNGRWATDRGLKRTEGHKAGYKNLKKLSTHIMKSGVKYLSIFVFSTENFKRTQEEVDYLMNLFVQRFKIDSSFFNKNNIKVIFSGRRDNLREDVLSSIESLTKITSKNDGCTLNICLNYGGRSEIIDATKKIVESYKKNEISLEDITEESFKKYLYNDLPEVDLLIRTGKEKRISNFMLYLSSYSELYFTDTYFPDFDEKCFDKALEEFNMRNRRFGKN